MCYVCQCRVRGVCVLTCVCPVLLPFTLADTQYECRVKASGSHVPYSGSLGLGWSGPAVLVTVHSVQFTGPVSPWARAHQAVLMESLGCAVCRALGQRSLLKCGEEWV